MTEKEVRSEIADLEWRGQLVCMAIAMLREKLAVLEADREYIRMDQRIVHFLYVKERNKMKGN